MYFDFFFTSSLSNLIPQASIFQNTYSLAAPANTRIFFWIIILANRNIDITRQAISVIQNIIFINHLLLLYCSVYMRIQYFISRVIFYISLVILLTFLSLMVTTFCTLISALFVGSCSNALDCVDLMSRCAVTCVSNKRRRTFIDDALRLLQLILSYTLLIGNILSFSPI